MPRSVDIALGASAVYWALDGVYAGHGATLVGATVLALNLTAGILFLVRRRARREGTVFQVGLAMLSIPTSMAALAVAPAPASWPLAPSLLFAVGGLGAVLSLATLGTSFGVLPAVREVVKGGPFAIIRHPAYACELWMVLACALAAPTLGSLLITAVALALVIVRVRVEEEVLSTEPMYAAYQRAVRFRLVPLLW